MGIIAKRRCVCNRAPAPFGAGAPSSPPSGSISELSSLPPPSVAPAFFLKIAALISFAISSTLLGASLSSASAMGGALGVGATSSRSGPRGTIWWSP